MEYVEINFLDLEEDSKYEEQIKTVLKACFEEKKLLGKNLYVNVILTTPERIREINKKHRNIDSKTDVLSFPMFEKHELETMNFQYVEVLGDIIISLEQVKEQAIEYEHSFEREFAYMLVHGFCHLIGFDHIKEEDKKIMRMQEETILSKLNLTSKNL